MNLMLHGIDSGPEAGGIRYGDTLSPEGEALPKATLILTNPPFGTRESRPVGASHAVGGHNTQACGLRTQACSLGYRIEPRWGWNAEPGPGTEEVEA